MNPTFMWDMVPKSIPPQLYPNKNLRHFFFIILFKRLKSPERVVYNYRFRETYAILTLEISRCV